MGMNLAAVALCLWMTAAPKPPVYAQAVSAEDQVQNTKIEEINKHLESSDGVVDRLVTQVNAQGDALSELEGEERIFFAILTLITGGNFVFQAKGRK